LANFGRGLTENRQLVHLGLLALLGGDGLQELGLIARHGRIEAVGIQGADYSAASVKELVSDPFPGSAASAFLMSARSTTTS
jgi:hypothetical protein